uniref:Conserved plasma membrane protein n=1 Tax=Gongylonema pulchrum TaxID=637853 RepID=A0A183EFS5_9BILA
LSVRRDGKLVIDLTARCFNSTVAVEKHEDRCPWCIEYHDDTVINQQYPEETKIGFMQFVSNESYLNILVIGFALATALSSALCAFLLFLYIRQKKTAAQAVPRKCCQPYSRTGHLSAAVVHVESPSDSAESSRYDTPWDRKYRPLPRWTSCRSNASSASPPDTSSTTTGSSSQHSKSTKVIIGNVLHEVDSPDSSIYERPEDRGLGSVRYAMGSKIPSIAKVDKSNASSASPPDTSSTTTGSSSQHSKSTKVIIGNVLHEVDSPDSSIYERPEDRSLGSV